MRRPVGEVEAAASGAAEVAAIGWRSIAAVVTGSEWAAAISAVGRSRAGPEAGAIAMRRSAMAAIMAIAGDTVCGHPARMRGATRITAGTGATADMGITMEIIRITARLPLG